MYDPPTRFCEVVGFDSESESDDIGVDVVTVDGGGLEAVLDVDGCQRLASVPLTFFLGGGIVCVWEE